MSNESIPAGLDCKHCMFLDFMSKEHYNTCIKGSLND
jgi:hypothetical protein